jgi:hypothetical protein
VSYFRPLQAGKTGPRTVNRFPDSTSQLSQNAGQVQEFMNRSAIIYRFRFGALLAVRFRHAAVVVRN